MRNLAILLMVIAGCKSRPDDPGEWYVDDPETDLSIKAQLCGKSRSPRCEPIAVKYAEEILKGESDRSVRCRDALFALQPVVKRSGRHGDALYRLQSHCCPLRLQSPDDDAICPAVIIHRDPPRPPMSPLEKEMAYLAERNRSEFIKLEHCAQSATDPCDEFVRTYAAGLIERGDPSGGLGCYEALGGLRPRAVREKDLLAKLRASCCPLKWRPAHGADMTLCR